MRFRRGLAPVERPLLASWAQWHVAHVSVLVALFSNHTYPPVVRAVTFLVSLQIETLIYPPLGLLQTHREPDFGPVLYIANS